MIQKTLVEFRLSTRELLDCPTSVGRVLATKGPAPKPGCARWKSNPSRTLWTTYMLHRSPKTIFEMTLECSRLFSTSVKRQWHIKTWLSPKAKSVNQYWLLKTTSVTSKLEKYPLLQHVATSTFTKPPSNLSCTSPPLAKPQISLGSHPTLPLALREASRSCCTHNRRGQWFPSLW